MRTRTEGTKKGTRGKGGGKEKRERRRWTAMLRTVAMLRRLSVAAVATVAEGALPTTTAAARDASGRPSAIELKR